MLSNLISTNVFDDVANKFIFCHSRLSRIFFIFVKFFSWIFFLYRAIKYLICSRISSSFGVKRNLLKKTRCQVGSNDDDDDDVCSTNKKSQSKASTWHHLWRESKCNEDQYWPWIFITLFVKQYRLYLRC